MVNRLYFILLGIMAIGLLAGCDSTKPPVLRTINFAADYFNPVHEAKAYDVNAFRISDWVNPVGERLEVTVPDTLELSWNQPKRRVNFNDQAKPVFYPHVDTARVLIPNSVSIYRYLANGNDSSCFVDFKLEGLYEGEWEISMRCLDLYDKISQYSTPFQIVIRWVIVPSAPIDVRLWIR